MSSDLTPAQAWRELSAGNDRFVHGTPEHPHQDLDRRRDTADAQAPFATVFGCMDSRVAAELIFDRGLGDLAVVRTAGHIVDSAVLGSLEFAVSGLGTPLIVVLGHDQCGAVGAALSAHADGMMPAGYLREIVERLTPSLVTSRQGGAEGAAPEATAVMQEHVRSTVRLLAERSTAISRAIDEGRLAVVGAEYRLAEGRVRTVESLGDLGDLGDLGEPGDTAAG